MDKTKKGSKAPRPLSEAKGKKQPPAYKPKLVSKPPAPQPAELERLQKVLAEAGVASRRSSEQLILQRRVRVNGNLVTELGTKVDPAHDVITVDNKPLPPRGAEEKIYIALHKPRGYVTTSDDEQGRETVLDLIGDVGGRVYPVGRLDNNSEGLLLLTNDGDLTFRLTHPRYKAEKEYEVQTDGVPSEEDLQALRTGIVLDDGVRTQPATVELLHHENDRAWISFIISEGRKRQVRNMLEAVGLRTRRLIRMRIGPLRLGDLKRGEHRNLTPAEVRALRKAVGLDDGAGTTPQHTVTPATPQPVAAARPSRFVRQGGGSEGYQSERPPRSRRPNQAGRSARPAANAAPPGSSGKSNRATPRAGARPFPANGNPATPSRTPRQPAASSRPAPGGNRPAPARGARPFPANGNPATPSRPPQGGNRAAPGGYHPPKAGPAAPARSGPAQGGSRPSRPAPSGSRPPAPAGNRPAHRQGSRPASRPPSHPPQGRSKRG